MHDFLIRQRGRATTTRTGLRVHCELDPNLSHKGVTVTKEAMQ